MLKCRNRIHIYLFLNNYALKSWIRGACLLSASLKDRLSSINGKVFKAEQPKAWHRNGFCQAGSREFWKQKKNFVVALAILCVHRDVWDLEGRHESVYCFSSISRLNPKWSIIITWMVIFWRVHVSHTVLLWPGMWEACVTTEPVLLYKWYPKERPWQLHIPLGEDVCESLTVT